MNEKQKNIQNSNKEINLQELMILFWKRKKTIVGVTLVMAILAALFSKFMISPVYDTKLNIIISMPDSYSTRYGEYKLPLTSNEQYIDLILSNDVLIKTMKDMGYSSTEVSLERLRRKVNLVKVESKSGTVQNSFDVIVSSDNPNESLKFAESLYRNYIEFIDAMTKERAINYYFNYFKIKMKTLNDELDRLDETLKKNEELLNQTPQLIAAGKSNIEIQTQLNKNSQYVIPVDTINPNYIKIENDIVENKQSINDLENSIRIYKNYLEEIEIDKDAIGKYYESGESDKLETSLISIVETSVYLPSPPVAPTKKTSPSNSMNTLVGAVIGGAVGVMIVLIKEYWIS